MQRIRGSVQLAKILAYLTDHAKGRKRNYEHLHQRHRTIPHGFEQTSLYHFDSLDLAYLGASGPGLYQLPNVLKGGVMLGKLMVNTVDDGNSCGERLNELVVIGTDEIVCNDEPYYPVRVERSHMDDIAKAVNSHHAMKEALENCLEVVGSWDEEPEWVLQAKKALTLANGGSTDE